MPPKVEIMTVKTTSMQEKVNNNARCVTASCDTLLRVLNEMQKCSDNYTYSGIQTAIDDVDGVVVAGMEQVPDVMHLAEAGNVGVYYQVIVAFNTVLAAVDEPTKNLLRQGMSD